MTELTEETIVDLAAEVIGVPTPNPPGNEGDLADLFERRLASSPVDWETERYDVEPGRPNLIARAGDPGEGTLLFTGHMDTVPANAEDWASDPFELVRRNGRIAGRGTSDMKCALAAELLAAEAYLADGGDGEIVLAFVMNEERGGRGTQAMVERGIEADAAILGEPTDMGVGIAQKGIVRYRLTTHGRDSHAGRPDLGDNAVTKLGRVIERMGALDSEMRGYTHDLLEPGGSVTVTEIEGGVAPNVVPGEAALTIDWRTVPGMEVGQEWLDARLDEALSGLDFDVGVEVIREYGESIDVPPDEPIVETLTGAARDCDLAGDHVGLNGGTDARYLVHDADIPTVLFGPGSLEEDAHTVDESIRADDLVTATRVYRRAAERFFG